MKYEHLLKENSAHYHQAEVDGDRKRLQYNELAMAGNDVDVDDDVGDDGDESLQKLNSSIEEENAKSETDTQKLPATVTLLKI